MFTPLLVALGMTAFICVVDELTRRCVRASKENVRTVLD
jgi:hypothetical protein